MTNKEKGKELIDKARRILHRELKPAYEDKDIDLIIRRAQEVVELSIKGALVILGIDYPKNQANLLFMLLRKRFLMLTKKSYGKYLVYRKD